MKQDKIPLKSIKRSLPFEIWGIIFVRSFHKPSQQMGSWYIATTFQYLTKRVEVESIQSCTKELARKIIFENIITTFGCLITLINDRGTHFINQTIEVLLREFLIDHHKSLSYHP